MRGRCRPSRTEAPRTDRGFSTKRSMRPSSATAKTPKWRASSIGASTQPIVTAALRAAMRLEHRPIVHLVDMVTGEDEHQRVLQAPNGREIAVDRVRRAAITEARCAFLGAPRVDDRVIAERRACSSGSRGGRAARRACTAVATPIVRTPEFTQFDSEKSMQRYAPPKGRAGLQTFLVSGSSRVPLPPASTTATVRSARLAVTDTIGSASHSWLNFALRGECLAIRISRRVRWQRRARSRTACRRLTR